MSCPVQVATNSFGNTVWSPPMQDLSPSCGRAGVLAELLSHRRRFTDAYLRNEGGLVPVSPQEALARTAEVLARTNPQKVGLLVDGNLSLEAVARFAELARGSLQGAVCSVYLPPSEADALEGMAASGASWANQDAYDSADVLVAVGDVFATHPVRARTVLDFLRRDRKNRFCVIDCVPTCTSGFATDFIRVPADGFVGALAAVAGGLDLGAPGLSALASPAADSGASARVLSTLKEAKHSVFLISPQLARASDWSVVSALCGLLANASGGAVEVLTSYGAAFGTWQLAGKSGMKSPAALAGAELDALLVIGLDVISALGPVGLEMVSRAKWVCCMASMPNSVTEIADVVIPMGFPFESSGRIVPAPGRAVEISPAAKPPAGAIEPEEAARALCRAVSDSDLEDTAVDWKIDESGPDVRRDLAAIFAGSQPASCDEEKLVLAGACGPARFGDGAVFGQCRWPQNARPRAQMAVSAADARRLGLSAGQTVEVIADGARETVELAVDALAPDGIALLDVSFAVSRRLLSWSVDAEADRVVAAPRAVTVQAVAEGSND